MAAPIDKRSEIICQLRKDILCLQGIKTSESQANKFGLGPLEEAFPNGVFPVGSVHEFVSPTPEQAAATCGFIGGLLAALMRKDGVCLWISTSRAFFPPAIKTFGVEPDRIIFVNVKRDRDILWAMEEALKSEGLAAAVAELREMDFVQSRRLQLAVEKSQVTGFVLRGNPLKVGNTACAARWQIRPLPSKTEPGMPGLGFPRWQVELLKVRNGNPGCWEMEWSAGRFVPIVQPRRAKAVPRKLRKIG